jgi:hypothetical protein
MSLGSFRSAFKVSLAEFSATPIFSARCQQAKDLSGV